jgi:hypothetical protein
MSTIPVGRDFENYLQNQVLKADGPTMAYRPIRVKSRGRGRVKNGTLQAPRLIDIPSLTGLRFIAAFSIALGHSLPHTEVWVSISMESPRSVCRFSSH